MSGYRYKYIFLIISGLSQMETVGSERYSHAHCEPNTLRNLLIIFRGDFNIIFGGANHQKVEDPL